MKEFTYKNEKTKEISFPLGGIGTGSIGLAGNGRFVDVEIFNKPNKGSHAAFSHFAVKVEDDEKLIDARVINSDVLPPYTGNYNRPQFNSYGFGVDRSALSGLPHFKTCEFNGEFPIAKLKFEEERFPGELTMSAFNPFIPLNDKDSTIPGAFFEFEITNTMKKVLTYSVAFTAANLYTKKGGIHAYEENGEVKCISLSNGQYTENDAQYGDMSIATDAGDSSHQLYWYRGSWFDNLATFWKDFRSFGKIKNRVYDSSMTIADANYAADDMVTLVAHVRIEPGKTEKIRFVWTWNTPNCYNYWNPEPCACGSGCCDSKNGSLKTWKNYYATLFKNSKHSAFYAMQNFEQLYQQTRLFKDTLFGSTMPLEAIDAVSANISIIKSPTCLRLEDGSLYGFEGCHCDGGCCEGSCTHVWNYTYAIPFLFPKLERSMRTLEYTYNMNPNGGMSFRLQLPIGRSLWQFRPCVDGQFGTVMRVYREYKISGDIEWLKNIWPMVKKSIEFAWSDENFDKWDYDKDGIMEGRQHHTLDMELFGKNAWLSGLYLGGLKAGAELANILKDYETEKEYIEIFNKGKAYLNTELFNGEYFYQKIDLKDRSLLDHYTEGKSLHKQDVYRAYWNDEQQELMYQIGDGCGIDQVLAQWHANLMGLGEIFDQDKTRSALKSIYKYNFIPNMREHFNPCRIYCLNDEGGLVICQWPEGKYKPLIPAPYSEETMHGFEYQAAIHMIQEGMVEEGMACIKAIRDRYDGEKRNPWNEFECGSNYARSMASYALLLTYSGFRYDVPSHFIGFAPIGNRNHFDAFWSLDSGWGNVCYRETSVSVDILYGKLALERICIEKCGSAPREVFIDGESVQFHTEGNNVAFDRVYTVCSNVKIMY